MHSEYCLATVDEWVGKRTDKPNSVWLFAWEGIIQANYLIKLTNLTGVRSDFRAGRAFRIGPHVLCPRSNGKQC